MREIEQSVDGLRRTVSEMARGLKLQTEAEWMGGLRHHRLESGDQRHMDFRGRVPNLRSATIIGGVGTRVGRHRRTPGRR
jgi:hypothetical protein